MYSRVARGTFGALVVLLGLCTLTGTAMADAKATAKCSAAIIKAGSGFVQAEAKILQKCRDTTLKGKTCDPVKTQASIDKARVKLGSSITKACAGKDKSCATADADGTQPTLADIGWNIGTCPNFEGGSCNNAINDCNDIPTCIQCVSEAAVNQAINLYYPPGRPSSVGNKTLNKCQASLGKAALTFLGAQSKALAKCWGDELKSKATCPSGAQSKIDAARSKFVTALAKPCLGLTNSTIGLPAGCPGVQPEGQASCAGGVDTLIDVGNCTACVTEFKVDCADRLAALGAGATYPPDCQIAPPTPTATVTPSPTATPTLTIGPTATSTPGVCGDGQVQAGEFCDGAGTGGECGAAFTCTNCNCACPSKVEFLGDPTDPRSILDTGWTGISHRAPIITNGDVTVSLSCAASQRPCGVCSISGPIANPSAGAGQLDDRRCSNDPSRRCSNDATCTPRKCLGGTNNNATCTNDSECPGASCPAAGTCAFYFGSNLPLAAGGVSTCVANTFNGSISGTANVETGEAVNTALLTSRVFLAATVDQPCSRCVGDTTLNDGVLGGTCDSGPRQGLSCDGNGSVPGRPDFGTTSLDCPSPAGSQIATLGIDLSNATGTVTRTLTANSPGCSGQAGSKCLCGTCNNGNNQACFTNADCPDPAGPIGPICNGKRCLGSTNAGAACTVNSECPSSSCAVPGSPTKPSGCQDDTTNNIIDCSDAADGTVGNQEGACTVGPVDTNCTVASGHGQRGCSNDADCGGSPGSCGTVNRVCFLTGGGTFTSGNLNGTDTLVGVGQADTPVNDVSHPTLAAVFCVAPTGRAAVDNVAGLPGPARVTIHGTATGLP